jgi:hypothetical protein
MHGPMFKRGYHALRSRCASAALGTVRTDTRVSPQTLRSPLAHTAVPRVLCSTPHGTHSRAPTGP